MTEILTQQEMFSAVVIALRKQGTRSMVGETCVYLDGSGNRCAVGHLLTEEEIQEIASRKLLGASIRGLINDGLLPIRFGNALNYLDQLQRLHDQWVNLEGESTPEDLERRAACFANDRGLNVPEI